MLSPDQYVTLFLEESATVTYSRVGSGERNFLVLKTGRKFVWLFYLPTLAKIKIPIEKMRNARPAKPRRGLLSYVKAVKRERKKTRYDQDGRPYHMPYSKDGTRLAIELLSKGN